MSKINLEALNKAAFDVTTQNHYAKGTIITEPKFQMIEKNGDQKELLSFVISSDLTSRDQDTLTKVNLWEEEALKYKDELKKFDYVNVAGKLKKETYQDKDDNTIKQNVITASSVTPYMAVQNQNMQLVRKEGEPGYKIEENANGQKKMTFLAVQTQERNTDGTFTDLITQDNQKGGKLFTITLKKDSNIDTFKEQLDSISGHNVKVTLAITGRAKTFIDNDGKQTYYLDGVDMQKNGKFKPFYNEYKEFNQTRKQEAEIASSSTPDVKIDFKAIVKKGKAKKEDKGQSM